MKKRIYLSHPYGGFLENRENAAALAKMYREIWDAEGMTDWEIVNPIEYFAPLAEEGVDDETILKSMSSQMFSSATLLNKLPEVKMEVRSEDPVSCMCRCSAERAASMIAALPDKSELPPTLDVTCHMCGRTWTIRTGNKE